MFASLHSYGCVLPGLRIHVYGYIQICDTFSGITRGLPLITYAPRGRGGGQASYTFLLGITCKKGGGGPNSM